MAPLEGMTPRAAELRQRYAAALLDGARRTAQDNWADYRFGPPPPVLPGRDQDFIDYVLDHLEEFAAAQAAWSDRRSAEVLEELLLFRSLGPRHVTLPTNTPAYREVAAAADTTPPGARLREANVLPVRHKFMHVYEVPDLGAAVLATNGLVINLLHFHQYRFARGGVAIAPRSGDVILDCGACWGDTTVLLASLAAPGAEVHAFEFIPDNLQLFARNLGLNPQLAPHIHLCPRPLGRTTGELLRFVAQGPGSRQDEAGTEVAETIAIDDYVAAAGLARVDFIKMDIEGCEAAALAGARQTIARWRPRLAISAYHRRDDLFVLPALIRELWPGYAIYLEHHTIHAEETVIYAIDAGEASSRGAP
jgi:FkbM family methyltransferase